MSEILDIPISTLGDWADCSLRASLRMRGIHATPYVGKRIAQIVGDEVHRAGGFLHGADQGADDKKAGVVEDVILEDIRIPTDMKQKHSGEMIAFDKTTPDWTAATGQVRSITENAAKLGYSYAMGLSLPIGWASEKRVVFDTGDLRFVGNIDVVLHEEDEGVWHVAEIKTSLREPKGWQYQLGMYARALKQEFPHDRIKGLLLYANRATGLVSRRDLSDIEMGDLMAAAGLVAETIRAHPEYPNPLSSRCSYCDYNGTAHCPITQSSEENDGNSN